MTLDDSEDGRGVPAGESLDPAAGVHPDLESALIAGLSEAPPVPGESGPADIPEVPETAAAPEDPDPGIDADFESMLLDGLAGDAPDTPNDTGETEPPEDAGDAVPDESGESEAGTPLEAGIETALLEGLADGPQVSSGDPRTADPLEGAGLGLAPPEIRPGTGPPVPGGGIGPEIDAAPAPAAPEGPLAALAFASDPETEHALREGLMHFEGLSPGCEAAQVWPGGLRAAAAALAGGHSTRLVIVDIDGIPYPAGAIHDLAEVCEIGTVVIALGSHDSARANREIMLAGVSDYLVKPVTARAIRESVALATAPGGGVPVAGHVAGFAGTGGSGATTVAAATALHAAAEGGYVSILDLNRTVPAMALLLDVEPAAGLDQLFDVAGRMPPDAQMLDGVRAGRSDRISLYAYRLGVSPPPVPPMPALDWLLAQLRLRSQLVLVDGLDHPETWISLLAEVDTRVLVAEPTAAGAVRAARILDLMGGGAPPLLVQNHTRAFAPEAGARLLREAGIGTPPDVAIPFEASLPEIADRGWPGGRLPRRLRKPVAGLADLIRARAAAGRPALPGFAGAA